jgi:16S rRNA (guanine527-N7)-methyltransferase
MFHVKQLNNNEQLFQKTIDLLFQENHHHNLSGIKDWQGMYEQHILDSKFLSDYILQTEKSDSLVLDLGSGAGFPGLVIAIENPDKKVIMIDSNKKKTDFINLVLTSINLSNASSLNKRIEDHGCPQNADIVCAKALTSLDVLLEYASPLLKINGILVAMKSLDIEQELADAGLVAGLLGFDEPTIVPYSLFQRNRQLVVFKKIKKAKIELPRNNGEAKNKPLRSKK